MPKIINEDTGEITQAEPGEIEVLENPTSTEGFQAMDSWDAQQMMEELEGLIGTSDFFYSFKQGGRNVGGLSWKGVKAIVQSMTEKGYSFSVELMDKSIEDGCYEMMVCVTRTSPDGASLAMLGVSQEDQGQSFALQKAMSKAQRNAYRAVIPEHVLVDSLNTFLNQGKGSKRQLSGDGQRSRGSQRKSTRSLPPSEPPVTPLPNSQSTSTGASASQDSEPSPGKPDVGDGDSESIKFLKHFQDGGFGTNEDTLRVARLVTTEDKITGLFGPDTLDQVEIRLGTLSAEVGEPVDIASFREILMAYHYQAVGADEHGNQKLELSLRIRMATAVGLMSVSDEDWASPYSKENAEPAIMGLIREARSDG